MAGSERSSAWQAMVAARLAIRFLLVLVAVLVGVLLLASGASADVGTSDVSVTKSGPATATTGTNVTYTITVTNNGPDTATNVTMDDTLPAGETFQTFAFGPGGVAGTACTLPLAGTGGGIHCKVPGLSNGQTNSFIITVQVVSTVADSTVITNIAAVASDQTDPDLTNNSSSSSMTVSEPRADLSITKTGPATAKTGSTVTYTISIANNGPATATNVTTSDTLPAGETLQTFDFGPGIVPGTSCSLPAPDSGGTITCNTPSLADGQTNSFIVTVKVLGSVPEGTVITNTATITLGSGQIDPDPTNNSSSSTLTAIVPRADISISKTGPATAKTGSTVTYIISITNNGPDTATNVATSDALPAGETFQTFEFGPGVVPGTSCFLPAPDTGGNITCNTPSLSNGQTNSFIVTVKVLSTVPDATVITNTATVTADQLDPDLTNNSSSSTMTVSEPRADISITKTGPATAKSGSIVTYTISITNNGPDTATNVATSDTLPAGETFQTFEFGPGVVPGTSCFLPAPDTGGNITCNTPSLSNGQTNSFIVTVKVLSTVAGGTVITNTATTSGGSGQLDPVPGNNTSSSTLSVVADTDLAITAGVSPAPVQATSAAGAAVIFTVPTASDEDGVVVVTCDHASGAVYPVGSTTVTCSAADPDDTPSSVSTTLTVMVTDTDLALTGVPAAMTVNATSPAGATVTYPAPIATDEESPPAVSCDHPSGSTFPIGTTTVTCSAADTDDTPSTASATFTVTVTGVVGQLQALLAFVQPLPPGTSFSDKVLSVIDFYNAGDIADACGTLAAIVNQANAQSGKQLTVAQANNIVAAAKQIQAVIPCP